MERFAKYLTESEQDMLWGLSVSVAGHTKIPAGIEYPPVPKKHPSAYQFTWENGRRLDEYQILYITKGKGVIETEKSKKSNINEGTILLLFPKVWHRYKCSIKTGWDEYYIGFKGNIADNFLKHLFIDPSRPIMKIGHKESVIKLFMNIIDKVNDEKSGFQQEVSGALIHLLGKVYSLNKTKDFEGKEIEEAIQKARLIMVEKLNQEIDIKELANELNKSYSLFRKQFKEYTGLAPGQYYLQLKINKAKELLLSTNLSVKTIAFDLGFESNFYFSRVFKTKTGMPPQEFRKRAAK